MTISSRRKTAFPALALAAGLLSGCGAETPDANLPTPKPATADEQKKAAADVEAGRTGFKSPGVANTPKAPGSK